MNTRSPVEDHAGRQPHLLFISSLRYISMGTCSRCGASGEMTYGADGQQYCSSCSFYGTNKQCYRCRMYLPATELQQYRGQLVCPYCLQDMRSEDRRSEAPQEKGAAQELSYPERCERCGRNLEGRVYIWNSKTLCKSCLEEEKKAWDIVGGGPSHGSQRSSVIPMRKAKQKSLLESIISDFLALLGLKKKEPEIIVVEPNAPVAHIKPMAERIRRKDGTNVPEAEGIMRKKPDVLRKKPRRTRGSAEKTQ
jgi:hypothetical protein